MRRKWLAMILAVVLTTVPALTAYGDEIVFHTDAVEQEAVLESMTEDESQGDETEVEGEMAESGEAITESAEETQDPETEETLPETMDEEYREETETVAESEEDTTAAVLESEEETLAEEELDPSTQIPSVDPSQIYSLTMEYDDRLDLNSVKVFKEKKMSLVAVVSDTITSCQVSGGNCQKNKKDTELITWSKTSTKVTAVGIGTGKIYTQCEDGSYARFDLTVEAAVLTVMLLTGQSNMKGTWPSSVGAAPADSVMCKDGEVYHTNLPTGKSAYNMAQTNISCDIIADASNAKGFFPSSLGQASTSLSGTSLIYPLELISRSGGGKNGPDAGLAYEWNRLTGDKVWVISAAKGSTGIENWMPGADCYDLAVKCSDLSEQVVNAEVEAGHYKRGKKLVFWLQGEQNRKAAAGTYSSKFRKMYDGFCSDIKMDAMGLIMVRSAYESNQTGDELFMTGPRAAQYLACMSSDYPRLYLVSNVNEQWTTDSGVKRYFLARYSSGVCSYPLRSTASTKKIPTTIVGVHPDVHYTQVAHNENGIDAANNMYRILYQTGAKNTAVEWRSLDGKKKTTESSSLSPLMIPVPKDVYNTKQIKVKTSGVSYNLTTGVISGDTGSYNLTASIGSYSATCSYRITKEASLRMQMAASDLTLTWNAVIGADHYEVYRSCYSPITCSYFPMEYLESTDSCCYSVPAGVDHEYYKYVVIPVDSDGERMAVSYVGKSELLKGPLLTGLELSENGFVVSWQKQDATEYWIYRKGPGDTKWVKIAVTDKNTYLDKKVRVGKEYRYTVRAVCEHAQDYVTPGLSGYESAGIKGTYQIPSPIPTVTGGVNKVSIKWSAVKNATEYRIYSYDKSTGKYSVVAKTTGTSYTVKGLSAGTSYTYLVRALVDNTLTGYTASNLRTAKTLCSAPAVTAAGKTKAVTLKWNRVKGATAYRIYRYHASTDSYSMVGTTTELSYTEKNLSGGTIYEYLVCAYNGTALNPWTKEDHVRVKTLCDTPECKGTAKSSSAIRLYWTAEKGATEYRIYRYYASTDSYKVLGTTVSAAFTVEGLAAGTNYRFLVRAFNGDAFSSYSENDRITIKTLCQAPEGLKAAAGNTYVNLSWNEVKGAQKYRVYRYDMAKRSYEILGETTETRWKTTGLRSGKKYYFLVRAYNGTALSDYSLKDMISVTTK